MNDLITKQMVSDAFNRKELDRDSRIFIEIEGCGNPFFATTAEGMIDIVALTCHDEQDPIWAHEIMFSPTFTDDWETPIAYHVSECSKEFYAFNAMDIRDLGNISPDLYLYSDGTVFRHREGQGLV